ncbi:N6-adenosine-specific RNA methylase IME4 [Rhizobium sp. AN5]|uniref:MT-A70 family methyltransferase n=1 Tax=Rhizobium sp. AN5 TaxID=1855304 RepID=UPI000BCCC688|nr:MT-A70 family methyltransferase [Rhizobium sp. AN5]SOD00200.1 N6-adenosine-specific RNA methylase IME4 [Rhizobium sp. AN5]
MIPEPKKKIAIARTIGKIVVGNRLRNLDEAKVVSFMDSIKRDGLKTPITVFGKEDDVTVRLSAGGHRLEACARLGMSTILCFHELGDETDCELWEIDENLIRADLTAADRALFLARRKELYLIKHPETANGATGNGRAKVRQIGEATLEAQRFTAATADAIGQKERTIQRDVERGEKISRVALQTLRGTRHDKGVTLDQLKRLATPEAQERFARDLIASDKAIAAESKQIRTAQQASNREARLRMVGLISDQGKRSTVEMPRAAYPIIYADPPWQQEAWSDETGQDKGLKYPAMSLEEIKALCAGDKSPATQSAELWLWATANRTKHALEVMEAWGFEFVTEIIWDKIDIGMGRHVRDRHEKILIGKRGPISIAPLMGMQPPSLYAEKKTEHSRKPVWFAEQIDRQWPGLRKLELFQRKESLAEGDIRLNGMWDFWGNQAGTPESEAT